MKYIDELKIKTLLEEAESPSAEDIGSVLKKSKSLKRLTLKEAAVLLMAEEPATIKEIFATAAFVKDAIYGRRVVLFAPLYISNICANNCLYCAFKSDNRLIKRHSLSTAEIKEQIKWLLRRGHKRILMVAAESGLGDKSSIDYYVESVKAIYSARVGSQRIKRVNVNCAPLSIADFKKLKASGIGTYQLFQETYHQQTYSRVHPKGPKSDPNNRIEAVDRAFLAGIDDIGIGVLYGLYDWKFETLAMLMHIEHLEQRFKVGPHTISVPRVEPALGVSFTEDMPHKVSDNEFRRLVAILRLAVPYTGVILSTRESAAMRDELFSLGVSQVSAESRTSPGGYSSADNNENPDIQFSVGDQRSLEQVVGSLIEKKFIPSFCAACYRKERTGEAFMSLAKPGTIKGKCSMNALITLKEYLDDFASPAVKTSGYKLINEFKGALNTGEQESLSYFFADIDKGIRDEFV